MAYDVIPTNNQQNAEQGANFNVGQKTTTEAAPTPGVEAAPVTPKAPETTTTPAAPPVAEEATTTQPVPPEVQKAEQQIQTAPSISTTTQPKGISDIRSLTYISQLTATLERVPNPSAIDCQKINQAFVSLNRPPSAQM